MKDLFKLEPLQEILETMLWTGQVTGEIPISVILVGPSGVAKSKMICSYKEPQLHITDNISSMGIWDIVQGDSKGVLRFIVIPDINPTISRRSSTAQATIANLLSLTVDGTVRVDDGRREKKCVHTPMGLITSCTPEIYEKHARQWFALGLRRRIIPVFYSYSYTTKISLQALVKEGKIHSTPPARVPLNFKSEGGRPIIGSEEAEQIEKHSATLAFNLGKLSFVENKVKKWQVKEIVPISPHVTLRTLAMAHASRRNSARVQKEDIDFLVQFIEFTDPEKPRLI